MNAIRNVEMLEAQDGVRWLRPREAADALGISLRTLQYRHKKGQIERRKEGRRSYYRVAEGDRERLALLQTGAQPAVYGTSDTRDLEATGATRPIAVVEANEPVGVAIELSAKESAPTVEVDLDAGLPDSRDEPERAVPLAAQAAPIAEDDEPDDEEVLAALRELITQKLEAVDDTEDAIREPAADDDLVAARVTDSDDHGPAHAGAGNDIGDEEPDDAQVLSALREQITARVAAVAPEAASVAPAVRPRARQARAVQAPSFAARDTHSDDPEVYAELRRLLEDEVDDTDSAPAPPLQVVGTGVHSTTPLRRTHRAASVPPPQWDLFRLLAMATLFFLSGTVIADFVVGFLELSDAQNVVLSALVAGLTLTIGFAVSADGTPWRSRSQAYGAGSMGSRGG